MWEASDAPKKLQTRVPKQSRRCAARAKGAAEKQGAGGGEGG